jgi:hypothetical protein
MKKLIIFTFALLTLILSCQKDNDTDPMQIREIAWNSLSDQEKLTVTIDWKQAIVSESTFNGKNAYAVRFNTSMDALVGPIVVYIDSSSKVVLGRNARY